MRVGYLNYSNSYPFLRQAEREPLEGVELKIHPPATLNRMLRAGELDLSVISTFEYLKNSQQYTLLPDLCINSTGYVRSVLLYSRFPLKALQGQRILMTAESATSTHLLKILLSMKGIIPASLTCFKDLNEVVDAAAVLLIGDGALSFSAPGFSHVFDLAHEWTQATALPVVFALWALNGRLADHDKALVKKVHNQLIRARHHLLAHLREVAGEARLRYPHIKLDFIDYYQRLDFTMSRACINSICFYEQKLVEMGLLGGGASITMADLH